MMRTKLGRPVEYSLPIGAEELPLGNLLGNRIRLDWTGEIRCIHCDRLTRKSFGQGYCYPCFTRLARCDRCVVSPELCHFDRGTCREPEWGEAHCLIPHTVYLANASALKVGITRGLEPTGRWIDQGASQALAIRIVATRLDAGLAEVALKPFVSDRTHWRRMLRGDPDPLDLTRERDRLMAILAEQEPAARLPGRPATTPQTEIQYPVLAYPEKIVSHNLDRAQRAEGTLTGIKGQYLILDTGVLNIRKHAGYVLSLDF